eukprot:symbB.v1.2.031174.t1/scaffold3589.1/size53553/3
MLPCIATSATSLLATCCRDGVLSQVYLAWHAAANLSKVEAIASKSTRASRLEATPWIRSLDRASVGEMFRTWRFACLQHLLNERSAETALSSLLHSRRVTGYLACFTSWRNFCQGARLQDLKAQGATAYRKGVYKATSLFLEPESDTSKSLAEGRFSSHWHHLTSRFHEAQKDLKALVTLTAWKSILPSKLHLAQAAQLMSRRLQKRSSFLLWKAMAYQENVAHLQEATGPELRFYLTAWKLGTDNQILRRQLRDGMQIAVACTSAALKQGYVLLLQRAWDAWIGQVETLPTTLPRHGTSLPLSTLEASWLREDLQFQRVMLLAWHKAVLVEILPAKLAKSSSNLAVSTLQSSWLREDIQLQRAMFYGWQRAVLVSAYASDLRLLQQRLESAASHVFRVTSSQQAEQLEASLHCLFLCWRACSSDVPCIADSGCTTTLSEVASLQALQEQRRSGPMKQAQQCHRSGSSSSNLSRTSQLVALRQVMNAWHRACAQGEQALEDERSFMLRELNRLQEESRHRAIDMLDVMALSREAVALTSEGYQSPNSTNQHNSSQFT